jgi:hypothetical protein
MAAPKGGDNVLYKPLVYVWNDQVLNGKKPDENQITLYCPSVALLSNAVYVLQLTPLLANKDRSNPAVLVMPCHTSK